MEPITKVLSKIICKDLITKMQAKAGTYLPKFLGN